MQCVISGTFQSSSYSWLFFKSHFFLSNFVTFFFEVVALLVEFWLFFFNFWLFLSKLFSFVVVALLMIFWLFIDFWHFFNDFWPFWKLVFGQLWHFWWFFWPFSLLTHWYWSGQVYTKCPEAGPVGDIGVVTLLLFCPKVVKADIDLLGLEAQMGPSLVFCWLVSMTIGVVRDGEYVSRSNSVAESRTPLEIRTG